MTKIIIIEDNPINMKLATFLLHSAGHEVLQATNAEYGLALIRTELPALVLLDIQLPGMDGIKAMRLLKADSALSHITVIALTANAMKDDKETLLKSGFDGYLPKPFHHQEFLGMVKGMLEKSYTLSAIT